MRLLIALLAVAVYVLACTAWVSPRVGKLPTFVTVAAPGYGTA